MSNESSGPREFVFAWAVAQPGDWSSALAFLRRFKSDPQALACFRRLLAERGVASGADVEQLLNSVARLLSSGELVAGRIDALASGVESSLDQAEAQVQSQRSEERGRAAGREQGASGLASAAAAGTPVPKALRAEKTWVEVKLVDQDDDPIPNRKCKLKTPDGTVHELATGADGTIRLTGIDPGSCEVSFIDIDAAEWQTV